jgi:hypothetical protein
LNNLIKEIQPHKLNQKSMNHKTLKLLFILTFSICTVYNVSAQTATTTDKAQALSKPITPTNKVKNEKTFIKYSDEALTIMENRAKELSIIGVAVIGFIPGEQTTSWVSKIRVVNVLYNEKSNFLAIALTKASDMAVTLQNSGTIKGRKPLGGELGYQGGLIKKISTGYVFAVFSGGKTEQDLQVAQIGLDAL